MNEQPDRVYRVIDSDFGERLTSLPIGVPVWIVDPSANTAVTFRLWKERPRKNLLTGITTFKISTNDSAETALIGELGTIHLPHGIYSAKPPYTRIQVIGTPPSEKVTRAFAGYGFGEFSSTPEGFQATRKPPSSTPSN
jgi:hypothetical protein